MSDTESDTAELMAALEHFVVDNDDLLELEERIGRFNIFDALGVTRAEIRHSNFLAWLLDPAESHGQGSLFLRAILMDLMKQTPPELRAISPVELDGTELAGVIVRREWRNIDLLIECEEPNFVVAIENKVDSGEHSDQLQRYQDIVNGAYPDHPRCFVFLTPDGTEASDEDWAPYSYGDIYRVLTRVRSTNDSSIGDDVLAFLDHYLRLIGSRFMDDPKIDELCQRIYRNHRQALDLIIDRVGSSHAVLIGNLERELRERENEWRIINRSGKSMALQPATWIDAFPAICTHKTIDQRAWVVVSFVIRPKRCVLRFRVWPTNDNELRRKVIQRLTSDPKEFGMRLQKEKPSDRYASLGQQAVSKWGEENVDIEKIVAATLTKLDELLPRLEKVPAALAPLFDGYRPVVP